MSVWLLAVAFLAGWSTCFVGWLISRDTAGTETEIDLRDEAVRPGPGSEPDLSSTTVSPAWEHGA